MSDDPACTGMSVEELRSHIRDLDDWHPQCAAVERLKPLAARIAAGEAAPIDLAEMHPAKRVAILYGELHPDEHSVVRMRDGREGTIVSVGPVTYDIDVGSGTEEDPYETIFGAPHADCTIIWRPEE